MSSLMHGSDAGIYEVSGRVAEGDAGRYLPCLITRLTDEHPEESREVSQVLTLEELKREIVANIELILNSHAHPDDKVLGGEPAASSVLGLGLADFCGLSHTRASAERLRAEIERQIKAFEPRLDPKSVRVTMREVAGSQTHTFFHYAIFGRIHVSPLEGEMLCLTDLDLESSKAVSHLQE